MDWDAVLIAWSILAPLGAAAFAQLADNKASAEKATLVSYIIFSTVALFAAVFSLMAPVTNDRFEFVAHTTRDTGFTFALSVGPGKALLIAVLSVLGVLAQYTAGRSKTVAVATIIFFGNWYLCAATPISALALAEACLLGTYLFIGGANPSIAAFLGRWLLRRILALALLFAGLWLALTFQWIEQDAFFHLALVAYVASVAISGLSAIAPAEWYIHSFLGIVGARLLVLCFHDATLDPSVMMAGSAFLGLLSLFHSVCAISSLSLERVFSHATAAALALVCGAFIVFEFSDAAAAPSPSFWFQTIVVLLSLGGYWQFRVAGDDTSRQGTVLSWAMYTFGLWLSGVLALVVCARAEGPAMGFLLVLLAALAALNFSSGSILGQYWSLGVKRRAFDWRRDYPSVAVCVIFLALAGGLCARSVATFSAADGGTLLLLAPPLAGLLFLLAGFGLGYKKFLPRESALYDKLFAERYATVPVVIRLVEGAAQKKLALSRQVLDRARGAYTALGVHFVKAESSWSENLFWHGTAGMVRSLSLYFRSLNDGKVATYWFIGVLVCAAVGVVCVLS